MDHHDKLENRIYSVSQLTAHIKTLLEEKFSFVWITGEISNFNVPSSGHFYFTLKDERAQIRAVMFRGQNRNLKFSPEDGLNVTGLGRINVYEPRGSYQIIFEYLEPRGAGEFQIAFEQLKTKLSEEGLFDEKYKQQPPFLPLNISIITSPTGAVVYDIIKVINRRFPGIYMRIYPVKVQGEGADTEIAAAIELLNKLGDADVAILARGGGSIEDLSAFNSEIVARAIFSSNIPIISAVGHETDFTIADFVADLRAPTPSAAAEMAVPLKVELLQRCKNGNNDLITGFYKYIENIATRIRQLSSRLVDPRKQTRDLSLKIDDISARLIRLFNHFLRQRHERLAWWTERFMGNNPQIQIHKVNDKLNVLQYNLIYFIKIIIKDYSSRLSVLHARLQALSPAAILERGYSITRTIPEAAVVLNAETVSIGQDLEILLAKGSLTCRVGGKSDNGKKNI